MWRLLRGIEPLWQVGPLTGSPAPDPAALLGQYRQAQATSTAVTEYFKHEKDAPDQAKAFQIEAYQDLLKLSKDGQMASADVTKVDAIVKKLEAGHFLDQSDVDTMRAVVTNLGERMVSASPAAANMPDDLKHAIALTPNADRAIATYNELKALQPQNPQRLDDATIRTLTLAVAQPLTPDVLGQSGIMGKDGALHAAQALLAMNPSEYLIASQILANAAAVDPKQGDPVLEPAMILESIGARYKAESPPTPATIAANLQALVAINTFAQDIHGLPRDQLVAKTSIIDQTTGANSLQQAMEVSCGPTAVELMEGFEDPAYGNSLIKDGPLHGEAYGSRAAQDQLDLLKHGGGIGFSKAAVQTSKDLEAAVAERTQAIESHVPDLSASQKAIAARSAALLAAGATGTERKDLAILRSALDSRQMLINPAHKEQIERALADPAIAASGLTFGSIFAYQTQRGLADAQLAHLHALVDYATANTPPPDASGFADLQATIDEINKGTTKVNLPELLVLRQTVQQSSAAIDTIEEGGLGSDPDKIDAGHSRHAYVGESVGDLTHSVDDAHMDRAATELTAGRAVQFKIAYVVNGKYDGAHALIMTDVRGNSPHRQLEVTDPATGTTNWVTEADLRSGAFANDPRYGFNLGAPARTTDFYYPKE